MNAKLFFLVLFNLFGLLLVRPCVAQKTKDYPAAESKQPSATRKIAPSNSSMLLDEAEKLKKNDPKAALDKVEEALEASLIRNDLFGEAKCYLLLGEINEGIEEWKLALDNYRTAYKYLGGYKKTSEYKRVLLGLGHTNLKLGNADEALSNFKELLSLRLPSDERIERQLDISEVYYQMEDYAAALKAVDEIGSSKIADQTLDVKIQNQKAKIYAKLNELEKAQTYYQNSQNTIRSSSGAVQKEAEPSMQTAKEEITKALREQKRYDEEISLRNESIDLNIKSDNLKEVSKDKVELSKALEAKGETSAAIRELEEAAHIADTIGNPKEQAKAFLALADLYQKNGRNQQALSAYKKYSEAVTKTEEQTAERLTEKSELIKKQKDIEELSKYVSISQREETIQRATVARQQLIIYGLLLIIVIIAVASYFIYKNAQSSKTANQLLALKSLRSQMNPHFIFNALNSVNHFVAQNDERTANKFLSEFSRLMRLVLENSQEDFIPLLKEEEIISLYLKLEHYRFRDKFDYTIDIDEQINKEAIELPPMLIQPYIENAVWHGLRYKDSKGKLALKIKKEDHHLTVEIADNGIGRKRSAELKTENQKKHNSTGLKNIQERLNIINKVYKANYKVSIEDIDGDIETGTRVLIHIPIRKN